jgi:hypothetical protein
MKIRPAGAELTHEFLATNTNVVTIVHNNGFTHGKYLLKRQHFCHTLKDFQFRISISTQTLLENNFCSVTLSMKIPRVPYIRPLPLPLKFSIQCQPSLYPIVPTPYYWQCLYWKIFLFSETSRPALRPTERPVQWEPWYFCGGKATGAWLWPLSSI